MQAAEIFISPRTAASVDHTAIHKVWLQPEMPQCLFIIHSLMHQHFIVTDKFIFILQQLSNFIQGDRCGKSDAR